MTNDVKYDYFYIGSTGKIFRAGWRGGWLDKKRLEAGNHFARRKEAEEARKKISAALGGNKGVLGTYYPKLPEVYAIEVTQENFDMVAGMCESVGLVEQWANSEGKRWFKVDGYEVTYGNVVAFSTGGFETFEDTEQFERLYKKV